jgi:hypothetical protein
MFLCFHSCFCQEFFQLCESLFQIRCLDGAELHVQKGRQARSDSRMNLASINIRD